MKRQLLLLLLIFLSSCASLHMENRKHRKGIHISWNKNYHSQSNQLSKVEPLIDHRKSATIKSTTASSELEILPQKIAQRKLLTKRNLPDITSQTRNSDNKEFYHKSSLNKLQEDHDLTKKRTINNLNEHDNGKGAMTALIILLLVVSYIGLGALAFGVAFGGQDAAAVVLFIIGFILLTFLGFFSIRLVNRDYGVTMKDVARQAIFRTLILIGSIGLLATLFFGMIYFYSN